MADPDTILTDGSFPSTHWSDVLAVGRESDSRSSALGNLCQAYWYPLYAFARRQGRSPADAQDLTQAFFARFLATGGFAKVEQGRGRFRSFLLASFRNFMANERDRASAQKRGGGLVAVPLDESVMESRLAQELDPSLSAEGAYDRAWGLTMLATARSRVQAQFEAAGQKEKYQLLEPLLPGEESPLGVEEVATRLGLAIGSVRSEIHRLKKRFREALRQEVARTVDRPEEVDEEIRHLITAVGK